MKKLTCSYGKTFKFSMTEINGEPIMVVDADIKSYVVHLGPYSGTYDFPKTVVVNDKLYFNRNLKDDLLSTLDAFIETTYIQNNESNVTQRGFKYLNPRDIYGNSISIQESSNVEPAIWFGVDLKPESVSIWEGDELKSFSYPDHNVMLLDRLHLKMPQAKKMRKMLVSLWKLYE